VALDLTWTDAFAGATVVVEVAGAEPGDPVHLLASRRVGPGACPELLEGGCLDIAGRAHHLAEAVADARGLANLAFVLPTELADGARVALQAVALRGAVSVVSDAVEIEMTPRPLPGVAGNHIDSWGTWHHINRRLWEDSWGFRFHFTDVGDSWAVARNDEANPYSPGRYSRFDWTESDGLWYCQTMYDGAERDDALTALPADPSDPAVGGCSGFAWTALEHDPMTVAGTYTDEWGTDHEIREDLWVSSWDTFAVADYNNQERYLVAQNDPGAAWFPGHWSRFDWVASEGHLYYCQTRYDGPSEAAAAAAARPDDRDPSGGGCSGFAWTDLTP
jgi:hypothetical protein